MINIKYHLCLLTAGLILLASCSTENPLSPEAQVKQTLEGIEKAAENRDTSDFMAFVDESYSDHQGQTKQVIQRLVQFYILSNQSINILTKINELSVNGDIATVELSAAMAAKSVDLNDESSRLKADLNRFSIVLVKKNDNWLIQSVSRERGW